MKANASYMEQALRIKKFTQVGLWAGVGRRIASKLCKQKLDFFRCTNKALCFPQGVIDLIKL
jgi:hypothetical protein